MELHYGDKLLSLDLPPERVRRVIRPSIPAAEEAAETIIGRALDRCAETIKRFRPREKTVIVTSDITRYTGSEIYLPLLVERLNEAGIRDEDVEILVALGIHRRQTESEHRKIAGKLFGRIKIIDHDCDDPGQLVFLGTTSGGVPVEVNRRVAEADRVILTGTIGFHYFAGFGGGRKSILPGVAGRASCMASHFAVLNHGEGSGKNPLAATGILDGNPVHEALEEGCALVEPDVILNTVLSPDKRIIAAFSGHWRDAHREGCSYYAEHFSCRLDAPADLVVASCGGFPKDINFIQSHKSMEYGVQALKEGGVMILLAQCRDGYGNATFFNWFRHKNPADFEAALRAHYEINGQTAYSTLQKALRYRIILVSELPPEEVRSMSLIPASSLEDALERARQFLPSDYTAYIIPEGGTVLPVVAG